MTPQTTRTVCNDNTDCPTQAPHCVAPNDSAISHLNFKVCVACPTPGGNLCNSTGTCVANGTQGYSGRCECSGPWTGPACTTPTQIPILHVKNGTHSLLPLHNGTHVWYPLQNGTHIWYPLQPGNHTWLPLQPGNHTWLPLHNGTHTWLPLHNGTTNTSTPILHVVNSTHSILHVVNGTHSILHVVNGTHSLLPLQPGKHTGSGSGSGSGSGTGNGGDGGLFGDPTSKWLIILVVTLLVLTIALALTATRQHWQPCCARCCVGCALCLGSGGKVETNTSMKDMRGRPPRGGRGQGRGNVAARARHSGSGSAQPETLRPLLSTDSVAKPPEMETQGVIQYVLPPRYFYVCVCVCTPANATTCCVAACLTL